jgi:hypothetical protein
VLAQHKPAPGEDALFIFVGDEEAHPFNEHVTASGLNPVAFGFYKTVPNGGAAAWRHNQYGGGANNIAVRETANRLRVPCFMIDERTFDDPYAVARTIRALVAATPVGQAAPGQPARVRVTLVEQILRTPLLVRPNWA